MMISKLAFSAFAAILCANATTPDSDTPAATDGTKAQAETPDPTTDGVEILLGVGSRVRGTVSDYMTTSANVMESKTLGRATPQAMAGLGFPLCSAGDSRDAKKRVDANVARKKAIDDRASETRSAEEKTADENAKTTIHFTGFNCKAGFQPLSAFVSATFSSDTNHTISSYTIGLGYHVSKYLHVVGGFSLSPVSEPAPGFRNAAAAYVSGHPSQYPTFDPEKMRKNELDAFDGFQFVAPPASGTGNGTPIYPGDVLTTHYRGGLFIGVAFPLSLKSHLP